MTQMTPMTICVVRRNFRHDRVFGQARMSVTVRPAGVDPALACGGLNYPLAVDGGVSRVVRIRAAYVVTGRSAGLTRDKCFATPPPAK